MDKVRLVNFTSLERFQLEAGGGLHHIASDNDLLSVVSRAGDKLTAKCPTGKFDNDFILYLVSSVTRKLGQLFRNITDFLSLFLFDLISRF